MIASLSLPRQAFMSVSVSHPAWPLLINPHRFAEARAIIKKDPQGLLRSSGEKWEESAMHWVGMADTGSWLDLIAAGGDPNAVDKLGRTPLDWVNDRLYLGVMADHQRLGAPARDRIRVATVRQIPAIWAQGGRPGKGKHSLPPVKLWMEAGLWDLLSLVYEEPEYWKDWGEDRHNALHLWVRWADREKAPELLNHILETGIDIDSLDADGCSALWYAVDGWINQPQNAGASRAAIRQLLEKGADPEWGDGGNSPVLLPAQREVSPELMEMIHKSFGS